MKERVGKLWKEHKSFLLFITLMFMFRSAVADWNHVPTGSMKPTILEGDQILIDKMAYDIRVPFTQLSLVETGQPERGDIIIFESEALGKRLVKRLIGLPGDIVEMRNNALFLNGQKMSYADLSENLTSLDLVESIPGSHHTIRVARTAGRASSFGPVKIPKGHYFALGDNRDNSADSRYFGFVPRKEIIGRSKRVMFSLNYENNYLPRSDRFLQRLEREKN